MKKLFTVVFALIFTNIFSQEKREEIKREIIYDVKSTFVNTIKKEKLNELQSLDDLIPGYPKMWITSYISTEISVVCNGKTAKAAGINHVLTDVQKDILKVAETGADVVININYNYANPLLDKTEIQKMNYKVSIVPEIEAQYVGGNEMMRNYLKENAISKISDATTKKLKQTLLRFVVNEEGGIDKAQISATSGDDATDKLLLDAINKMPSWKPAEDSKGKKVKQEFVFSVGSSRGGC